MLNIFHSTLTKPPEFAPCNGCGYCCSIGPCAIAQEFIGAADHGPCPALEIHGQQMQCGMIKRPLHYLARAVFGSAQAAEQPLDLLSARNQAMGAEVAAALGAGKGCDAQDCEQSKMWPWPVALRSQRA